MAYDFTVSLGRLVCRDTESISAPHDIFGLSGAVVADGEAHGFVMEKVPINERQPFSYGETIFSVFVHVMFIGTGFYWVPMARAL